MVMSDISARLTMNYNQPDIPSGPLFRGKTNILGADIWTFGRSARKLATGQVQTFSKCYPQICRFYQLECVLYFLIHTAAIH